jgi:D-alanyl-lipoteichoic acid acyltransferase DltB (MBOAT superfamily)
MHHFLVVLRGLIAVTILFLCGIALRLALQPQFHDELGDARIDVDFTSATSSCFELLWDTEHTISVTLDEVSTFDAGTGTICSPTLEHPVLAVSLSDGTVYSYSRFSLWNIIASRLSVALLSTCLLVLTWLLPINKAMSLACLTLGLVWIWMIVGMPPLPILSLTKLPAAHVTVEGQVLLLALCVPPLYWWIPSRYRVPLLLGLSFLLLCVGQVSLEYLSLLSILMALTWAIVSPTVEVTVPLSSIMLSVSVIILTALGLGMAVSSQLVRTRPPAEPLLLVSGLCLGIALLFSLLQPSLRQALRQRVFFIIFLSMAAALIPVLCLDAVATQVYDHLAWWIFVVSVTGLCLVVCGLLRYQASAGQRSFMSVVALVLILLALIVLKWPPTLLTVRAFGFSYIAFRLFHVLLEYRLGHPVSDHPVEEWSLYLLFFPAQAVGPIDRWPRFASETPTEQTFSWADTTRGWERILWGGIKKFVIADIMLVHLIPNATPLPTPIAVILPVYAWVQLYVFAFYLYFDFSGFVDIAIGTAQLIGFHLPENFDRPYTKGSLAQFWQSWHMTLSNWLRTYIFLPLSRSLLRTRLKRVPLLIVLFANVVTMSLIGLWHGFSWNFLVWGLWHAVGLFLHKMFADRTRLKQLRWKNTWRAQTFHVFSVLLTFHFVLLGWVFFAFPTLNESIRYLAVLVGIRI